MKLLSHSNGLYKLDKEKISKIKILKRCAIFLVALLAIGFLIQSVNNLIDNSKLKSRFKYVRLDGKKVEYKLKGSGDYTVIFDGSIGTNLYEWDKVCKLLEEEDKVATFVYNRRGYGFNDGGARLTPEEQAQQLKLLLRKAGASEPYIFVGEQYGSLISTSFVELYPDSVAGVVLVNPINEKSLTEHDVRKSIYVPYLRSQIEYAGSNFSLTALLDKMNLALENPTFTNSLNENELEEFNSFKNRKNYREAVRNEIENLYKNTSDSQKEGVLSSKPLYIISDNEDEPLINLGSSDLTTLYVESIEDEPFSVADPESVVNGINTVIKQAKKLSKTS
ncbi:alpha/beta fold hydrolase [uncultured Clostridium sp.]|uniref:alpha/beta fold hydrolase n=1 Tax=uncultured Clostridium sp. TaxID=59620 RepID=UPI0025F2D8E3|nr:alpha/beta fold hydrolase [uncultured Clostridium sp.]